MRNDYSIIEGLSDNKAVGDEIVSIAGMRKMSDTSYYGSYRVAPNAFMDVIVTYKNGKWKVMAKSPLSKDSLEYISDDIEDIVDEIKKIKLRYKV